MSDVSIGSGTDRLVLGISEDPYQGDAQFTVSVDGQQVGDVLTAASVHGGPSDMVSVLGEWAPGVHAVTVDFLNDAYDGTPDTDRNLYVDSAVYDGAPVDGAAQTLFSAGPARFDVADGTPLPAVTGPATVGSGSDTLALKVSEDAYQGDAQFTVSVDGQQVGGILTAASPHGSGQSDTVNVLGNWAGGPHTVTVDFLNDAWDGTPDTDRNLYVDGATFNGAAVTDASLTLNAGGPQSFGLTDPGSIVTWNGSPAPQPGVNPGDTLILTGGTFTAQGGQLSGVTVDFSSAQAAPATVAIQDGSIGTVVPRSSINPQAIPSSGILDVTGTVTIEKGLSWGGRVAPGVLAVNLNGPATLNLNGGSLGISSSFVVNGSPGSTVTNTGTLSVSSPIQFAIHADLAGAGTIQSVQSPSTFGALIELDGAVSAEQTVRVDGGTLQLDQPMRFMGTVAGLITSLPGGPASSLRIEHTTVTGTSFQQGADNAGDLSVFTQDQGTGATGADVIHVAGSFASDAFVFTNDTATQSALVRLAPLQNLG